MRDSDSFVGRTVRIGSTSEHLIARYDRSRRSFVTRNLQNRAEGMIAARTLYAALEDGIARIVRERNQS